MNIPRFLLGAALAACSLVSILPSAQAALLWLPPGEWPDDQWSLEIMGTTPVAEMVTLHGHQWLNLGRSATNGSPQVIYNAGHIADGAPVAHPDNQLGDFSGQVIIGAFNWGYGRGVVLRAETSAYSNTHAYYLAATNTGLGLYWGVGSNFLVEEMELAFDGYTTTPENLTTGNFAQYLLEFSVIGREFQASFWALDEEGLKVGDDPLATLFYLDEREEARLTGYFGLRGGRYGGTNRPSYFRALEVTAVPEPGLLSLGLLLLAGGGLYRKLRFPRV